MHRREIGELLNPSALGFVPSVSVSLAADNAQLNAFYARHEMTRRQSPGFAAKQTSNDCHKFQFAIPKMLQDVS